MIDAREYARALFLISEEEKTTEAVLEDVQIADEAFSRNPAYVKLLDTPALPKEEKLSLIDGAFAAVNESLKNLIKILCEKHSVFAFSAIRAAFSELFDESRGIERVEAVSAVALSEEQILRLGEKLSALTKKKVIIKNTVDGSILGGMKLRYAGVQLDGSVKTQLESFEKRLKGIVI